VNAHEVKPVWLIQSLCAVCGSNLAGLTHLYIVLPCVGNCVPPCVADVSIVNCAVCQQFNKRTLLLLLLLTQLIGHAALYFIVKRLDEAGMEALPCARNFSLHLNIKENEDIFAFKYARIRNMTLVDVLIFFGVTAVTIWQDTQFLSQRRPTFSLEVVTYPACDFGLTVSDSAYY